MSLIITYLPSQYVRLCRRILILISFFSLPTLATPEEIVKALEDAGFDVIESFDANINQNSEHEIPWYQTLKGSMSLNGFRMTHCGRVCTHGLVSALEFARIARESYYNLFAFTIYTIISTISHFDFILQPRDQLG